MDSSHSKPATKIRNNNQKQQIGMNSVPTKHLLLLYIILISYLHSSFSFYHKSSLMTKPIVISLDPQSLIPSTGILTRSKCHRLTKVFTSGTISAINPESVPKVNFLVDLWDSISDETKIPVEGKTFRLKDYALTRKSIQSVLNHFQTCKDCAGENAILLATQDETKQDMLVLTKGQFKLFSDDPEDENEVWEDYDESLLGEVDANAGPIFPIENDDSKVTSMMKEWVRKVIADFNVCPFTMDPDKAGIPMGGVRYVVSRATTAEEAFYNYWKEVQYLLTVPEKHTSTVLLVFPEIDLFGNFELFEMYCESLSDGLSCSSLGLEDELQLVFFHPKYQFRDGMARVSESQSAANYARRSPWPMINILRTNQVRAAQRGIPTGLVYKQNEERLAMVGAKDLQDMLIKCDWSRLPAISANAKLEQIRVALERGQELQRAEEEQIKQAQEQSVIEGVETHTSGQCPFHQSEETTKLSDIAPSVNILRPIHKNDVREEVSTAMDIEVDVSDPNSLESFLRIIQETDPLKKRGAVNANEEIEQNIQESGPSSDESRKLSEEELLRLADDIDRWINSDQA